MKISDRLKVKVTLEFRGWSGGAMPVSGASYNLDDSRARAYCACSRIGWGFFGHFYSPLSILSSFSLSLEDLFYPLSPSLW